MMSTRLPRVWTAVAVGALAPLVSLSVVIAALHILQGGSATSSDAARTEEATDYGVILLVISQFVILAAAWIPAMLSIEKLGPRLGITTSKLAWWTVPILMLGTLAVRNLTLYFLYPLHQASEQYVEGIRESLGNMTMHEGLAFALLLGILPGFCEEVVYRGYVQTRLLKRLPVWTSIFVSSLLFAFAHIDPQYALLIFPLGVWLGIIAWRAQSIWPAVFCHFFNNSSALALWVLFAESLEEPLADEPVPELGGGFLYGSLLLFGIALWALWKGFKPAPANETLHVIR